MLRGSVILIQVFTIVFQCLTAYYAFRLAPLTRWRGAWMLVSLSLLGAAALKTFRLIQTLLLAETSSIDLYAAAIEWLLAFMLLTGVYFIRPIFEAARRNNDLDAIFIQKSSMGMGIYQDGRIVFANSAFAHLTGIPPLELREKTPDDLAGLFHPTDREIFLRAIQARDMDAPAIRREIRLLNKRGNTYWVESQFARVTYAGRPAIQIIFTNITERKQVELDLRESERRHRIISQLTSDFIYSAVVDAHNRIFIEWVSDGFDRITGYSLNDILAMGNTLDVITHPEDKPHTVEAHTFALSNQAMVTEYRILARHGGVIWVRDYLQPVWSETEQRVTHFIGAVKNVTDRMAAENAIKESEARWRGLVESAPAIIATIDLQHKVAWMNRPINRPLEESIGKEFHALLPAGERAKAQRALQQIFEDGAQQHLELEIPSNEGQSAWYDAVIGPIRQEGAITSAILVLSDITERKDAEGRLKYVSNHDVLTGLFNRAFFETEVSRLQKSRQFPVTIVMADMNNLKRTNDLYGHAAGDDLLRAIAKVLRDSFRGEDVVARIGGDEFAVLLPGTGESATQAALKRLREKLDAWNVVTPGQPLSLSIGAATGQAHDRLIDVMKLADNCMYEDKARQKALK